MLKPYVQEGFAQLGDQYILLSSDEVALLATLVIQALVLVFIWGYAMMDALTSVGRWELNANGLRKLGAWFVAAFYTPVYLVARLMFLKKH